MEKHKRTKLGESMFRKTVLLKKMVGPLAALMISAPAFALDDVLMTPSMETNKATESLLLNMAHAGAGLVAVGERGHIIFSKDSG